MSRAIAKALGRPSLFTVPSFGLKELFGEGAETILTGQFAVPGVLGRLTAQSQIFGRASLEGALRDALGGG